MQNRVSLTLVPLTGTSLQPATTINWLTTGVRLKGVSGVGSASLPSPNTSEVLYGWEDENGTTTIVGSIPSYDVATDNSIVIVFPEGLPFNLKYLRFLPQTSGDKVLIETIV